MRNVFAKYQQTLTGLVGNNKAISILFCTQYPEINYKTPYQFFLEEPEIFEDFFMEILESLENTEFV